MVIQVYFYAYLIRCGLHFILDAGKVTSRKLRIGLAAGALPLDKMIVRWR